MSSLREWPLNNEINQVRPWLLAQLEKSEGTREAASMIQMLLENLSGKSKLDLLIHGHTFTEIELVQLKESVKRILANVPIQHIIGEAHFFGMDFKVSDACLIPRPETEELVAWVLEVAKKDARILDVGSGSGCIPIALKHNLPVSKISSIDVSQEAITIAKANAKEHGIDVEFNQESVFDFIPSEKWDVIVSNPPYIPEADKARMSENVLKHEPELALFVPNSDPLKFYKAILELCKTNLASDGYLFVEIHEDFAQECKELFESHFDEVNLRQDLQGKDRMISASFI